MGCKDTFYPHCSTHRNHHGDPLCMSLKTLSFVRALPSMSSISNTSACFCPQQTFPFLSTPVHSLSMAAWLHRLQHRHSCSHIVYLDCIAFSYTSSMALTTPTSSSPSPWHLFWRSQLYVRLPQPQQIITTILSTVSMTMATFPSARLPRHRHKGLSPCLSKPHQLHSSHRIHNASTVMMAWWLTTFSFFL
jgi:hypothetical protein